LASLRHPCKFQRASRLGTITARYSSSGRQPYFAALNRGRHVYSAGRPSRWALAYILVELRLTRHDIGHFGDALPNQSLDKVTDSLKAGSFFETQCSTMCWLCVRKSIRPVKELSVEVLAWLSAWSEVHIICIWSVQLMPLPPRHLRLTQLSMEKRPLNGCLSTPDLPRLQGRL